MKFAFNAAPILLGSVAATGATLAARQLDYLHISLAAAMLPALGAVFATAVGFLPEFQLDLRVRWGDALPADAGDDAADA